MAPVLASDAATLQATVVDPQPPITLQIAEHLLGLPTPRLELETPAVLDPDAPAYREKGLQYVGLDGTVGIIANGAGLAMTTDSFVVSPLRFPGGSIGHLAVHGTVNDLAVSGARPQWLSVAFVIAEGFPIATLREIGNGKAHVRVTNLIVPTAFIIPMSRELTISQWHVPIDDRSHNQYTLCFDRNGALIARSSEAEKFFGLRMVEHDVLERLV